jgi:hypothetical protein
MQLGKWHTRLARGLFAGFTAPMCSSTACTPASPYCEKSSDDISAGISTTFFGPRAVRKTATIWRVNSGSLFTASVPDFTSNKRFFRRVGG